MAKNESRRVLGSAPAAALAIALLAPAALPAATYYVRESGDDANDGSTPERALASIRSAARLLLAPGDRLIVGPGTYREGNVEPRGSGTPDAPIVFLADIGGELSGDPPGEVTIVPPNTPDATTGFILFGRHDVVIEGFTIDGSADAGIQVRPHFSTGVDSTRITARNNVIRFSRQRGIQMTAAGDVAAIGNVLIGNESVGLAFAGGESGDLRPMLRDNLVGGSGTAIIVRRSFGVMLVGNQLRGNGRGIVAEGVRRVTVTGNSVDGRATLYDAVDVTVAGNLFDNGLVVRGAGAIEIAENQVGGRATVVEAGSETTVRLADNQLTGVYVQGGSDSVEISRNRAFSVEVAGPGRVAVIDNEIDSSLKTFAGVHLEVSRNRARGLTAGAAEIVVVDNHFDNRLFIVAEDATVIGNRSRFLTLGPRNGVRPEDVPSAAVVIADNEMPELLHAIALNELVIRGNRSAGIVCEVAASDSSLLVADNESRGSEAEGIRLIRAGAARVESNLAYESEECGFAAFDVQALAIVGNTFSQNGSGGLVLRIPLAGDCDGDLRVGIDEVSRSVAVAAGALPLYECEAADFDGDGRVTTDEILLATRAALGHADPIGRVTGSAQVEIRSNRIEGNRVHGVKVTATGRVAAIGNHVIGNEGTALAIRARGLREPVEVSGNLLGRSGGDGLLIAGVAEPSIRDNVIFSSRDAGIALRDAPDARIVNNLVYRNGNDGIAIGRPTERASPRARIGNNTLYGNGDWGITIGGSGSPSSGAVILDNIFDQNQRGGIAADAGSLSGLTVGFNLNRDGYAHGVVPSVTDFSADPGFIAPAGPDGILGGDGFADDDFHVRGAGPPSAVIDAGSAPAAELGIEGSVVAGVVEDTGVVDLGYHYGASTAPPGGSLHLSP